MKNFVQIKSGTFAMGSPASEPNHEKDEGPQHKVTVSSFYMGKNEVTQKEYQEVMGTNPSHFKGDNLPVEYVSWYDAVEYCNKRSEKEGLTPVYKINKKKKDKNNLNDFDEKKWTVTMDKAANGYRLPTEAEWEYACRAGTTTPFSTGDNVTTDQANYNGKYPYHKNPKGEFRDKLLPVGSFKPNPWGLYDMHGNVWEWCWDWNGDYSDKAQKDPDGSASGLNRVVRGGSFSTNAARLRSANRFSTHPFDGYYNIGFRVVRSSE